MKDNMRTRNIAVNSYIAMFIITLVGGFSALFLLHVIHDVPLQTFASAQTYDIQGL